MCQSAVLPPTALLFSATFRKKIERLARDILTDPIRVVQGDIGEVRGTHQTPRTLSFWFLEELSVKC